MENRGKSIKVSLLSLRSRRENNPEYRNQMELWTYGGKKGSQPSDKVDGKGIHLYTNSRWEKLILTSVGETDAEKIVCDFSVNPSTLLRESWHMLTVTHSSPYLQNGKVISLCSIKNCDKV